MAHGRLPVHTDGGEAARRRVISRMAKRYMSWCLQRFSAPDILLKLFVGIKLRILGDYQTLKGGSKWLNEASIMIHECVVQEAVAA